MSNRSSIQPATARNKNVPKELPTVQLDELPPHIRRIVTDTWLFLQIKVCKPCGRTTEEYNVKTCEKCGYTRIERIFYCSRTCQKRDWKAHKLVCGRDNQGPLDFGIPRTRRYNARRRAERAMWGWLESLRPVVEWATLQAYRISVGGDHKRTCLQFDVSAPERQSVYTPFTLLKITFRPLDSQIDHGTRTSDPQEVYYTVILNSRRKITGAIKFTTYRKTFDGDDINAPTKLWPWLLAETVHLKPDNPEIAKVLLSLLVGGTNIYKRENPSGTLFEPFRPPRIGGEWNIRQFDEWHQFMQHVIPWWTREPEVEGEEPQWQPIMW